MPTHHRRSRSLRALALAALALCLAATPADAQFGALKKKISKAVTGKSDSAATVSAGSGSSGGASCDESDPVVTNELIDGYLRSLAARDAEIRKMAQEDTPTGRYYAAFLKREAAEARLAEYRAGRGPDYARYQELNKKGMAGDAAAMQQAMQVEQELSPERIKLPELEWDNQRKADTRLDRVMAEASGFDKCDWPVVMEFFPRAAGVVVDNPNPKGEQLNTGWRSSPLSADEVKVLRARRPELAKAFGWELPEAKAAAEKRKQEQAKREFAEANPMAACMEREMKPFNDKIEKRQAELEAAQKRGDTAALMAFSQEMQAAQLAAAQKCAAQQPQDDE
jgi:hypothetical protein